MTVIDNFSTHYGVPLDDFTNSCLVQAANHYSVPELLLRSIVKVEGGKTGQCVVQNNKTMDCGIAQINSSHLPALQKYGINVSNLAHNNCVNLFVSSYILRSNYERKKDWRWAVIYYNIGPNSTKPERLQIGYKYANKVIAQWHYIYQKALRKTNSG